MSNVPSIQLLERLERVRRVTAEIGEAESLGELAAGTEIVLRELTDLISELTHEHAAHWHRESQGSGGRFTSGPKNY